MHVSNFCRYALLLFFATFLTACGGSNDDDDTPAPVVIKNGSLTVGGKPVENAIYSSTGGAKNTSGTTNASGTFTYTDNSTVQIRIGSTVLGTAPAATLASGLTMESLISAYTGTNTIIPDLADLLAENDDPATPQITLPADLASLNPIKTAIITVNGKPVSNVHYIATPISSGGNSGRDVPTTDESSDASGGFEFDSQTLVTFYIGTTVIGTRLGSSIPAGGTVTIESLIENNPDAADNPTLLALPNLMANAQGTNSASFQMPTTLEELGTVAKTVLTLGGKPVEGASFSSTSGVQSTSGTTDASGELTYIDDGTVEIRIGSTLLGTVSATDITAGLTVESLVAAYTGTDPVIQDLAAILADADDPATPQITLPTDLATLDPIRDARLTVNGKPVSNVRYIAVADPNATATRNIIASDAFSDNAGNFEFDALTNVTFQIGSAVIGSLAGSAIPADGTITLESLLAANTAAASNPTLSGLPNLLLISQGTPTVPAFYQLPATLAELDPVAKTVLTLGGKPISGVAVTSGSTSGLTNQNGVFEQSSTSDVTFKIDGLTIGTVTDANLPTSIEALVAANSSTYPVIRYLPELLTDLNAAGATNPVAGFRIYDLEQQLFKPDSLPTNRVFGMNLETPQAEADAINQPLISADIFRISRPFAENSCDDITYDSKGNPLTLPTACANADTANGESKYAFTRVLQYSTSQSVPAGTYTVLYDGTGTIHFSGMGCNRRITSGVLLVDLAATNGCPNPIDSSLSGFNNGDNPRGLEISITQIDPADPIRNIRIIMPGGICKGTPFNRVANATACGTTPFISFKAVLKENRNAIVFNPDYLSFAKDFRVLRMMNLMEASPRRPESQTNNPCPAFPAALATTPPPTAAQTTAYNAAVTAYNTCVLQPLTWAQRPTLDHSSWGGSFKTNVLKRQGVPLEVGIALANLLEAHPWFNIPHNADDNYVEEYALLIADELDESLVVHVEYSNEVWNSGFWGHNYNNLKGAQDNTITAMPNFPSRTTQYSHRTRYYAKRSTEIFKVFEEEFGDNARLKRILGGQHKNASIIGHMLSYSDTTQHTDAVAIAPYFHGCWSRSTNTNCANTSTVPQTIADANSLDDIFSAIDGVYNNMPGIADAVRGDPDSLDGTIKSLAAQKAQLDLITSKEIDLYAYEGGQHLTVKWGDSNYTTVQKNSLLDFMYSANRDPRMKDRYTTMLNGWKDSGAKLFVLFTAPQTFNRFGMFGIKEHINSTRANSPKYDSLLTFQEALNGCWTGYVEDGC